jgi:dTDP-4-dehydrorhamnose reductase
MHWLVVGSYGMLAQDLIEELSARDYKVTGVDRDTVDITKPLEPSHIDGVDVVVNCAAWTNVDGAEEHEDAAFSVNAVGPANIARALAGGVSSGASARLVQISTDYVFDGSASTPYTEDHPMNPVSAYGRTKAAGEWAVRSYLADPLIVRTAWLYGRGGGNFPKTMAKLARERDHLTVVDDQVGQPTWTRDLARLIIGLIEADAPGGVYHGTSSGQCSWFEFCKEVLASQGIDPAKVSAVTSKEFVRPAPRPTFSVLAHDALRAAGVEPIGDWRERWRIAASEVL